MISLGAETAWITAGAAGAASLLLLGPSLFLARRADLVDRPGGRKAHIRPTPLAGGIPYLAGAFGIPLLLGRGLPLLPALGGTLLFFWGLWDDHSREGLSWRAKLLGQAGAALLAGTALYPGKPWAILLFLAWAVLLQNALNFQDNMDGLCAGTGILLSGIGAALSRGPTWTVHLGAASAAALLPLLAWNFPRARLFLGDQASQVVGLTLALLSAAPLPGRGLPDPAMLFLPALPLLDMGATLVYRARRGLPLHRADRNHLSHRLSRAGLGPAGAVLALWTSSALLGSLLPLGVRALVG